MADGATEPARPWSRRIGWGLELLALTGFALTQPILSVFGDAPDVFIFRDATTADILLFAAVVTFVPPLALWLVELAVSWFSEKARRVVHATFLGALVVLLAIQVLKKGFSIEGPINLVLSVILGVMVVLLYLRVDVVGMFLRFASLAPIAFALLFVFSSPVSNLVFPSDVSTVKVQPPKNAPSTIMVIFDEWPTSSVVDAAGNVDPSQFPNLARLSNLGTWYRNSSSVSTATYYAVPALLTGNLPKSGDIPDASSHPQNLFTVFGQSYRMEAFESITRLCPRSLCPARSRGSSTGVPALLADARSAYRKMVSPSVQESEITAGFQESIGAPTGSGEQRLLSAEHDLGQAIEGRGDRFAQFLATIKKDEVPTLHFLHILLPHVPYRFLPSGLQYQPPVFAFGREGTGRDDWTDQTWPPALGHERLLLQTAYTDRLVGALLDRLRETGLLESSLLVVTADHGIAFTPGEPARGLTSTPVPESLYPQLLYAPLFIKAPGQDTGSTTDANVMSIDVFPTMAKLAGLELSQPVDGVPVGSRPVSDQTKVFEKASADGGGAKIAAPVRFDGRPTLRAMLADNVDANTAPGGPELKLWRQDPYGTLVGKKVSDLTRGADSSVNAKTVFLSRLRNAGIWKSRGLPPSMVWGSADRSTTLALAMNGVIAGVSPTFDEPDLDDPNFWALMVPDSLMRDGGNKPELYAVTGPATKPVVHRVLVRGG
jgi:Sulfatase